MTRKHLTGKVKFTIGVIGIYLFIAIVAPMLTRNSKNEVMMFIQENEINTSALFYTESEEALEAIITINTLNK